MKHIQEFCHLTLGAENDWMRPGVAHFDSVKEAVAGHFEVTPMTKDSMEFAYVPERLRGHKSHPPLTGQ